MGRHSKPSPVPRRIMVGVALATTGLTVSSSGAFAVVRTGVSETQPSGLPAVSPQDAPELGLPPAVPAVESVTVAPGDTLGAIGRRVGQSWQDLQRRNLDLVPRADDITPGTVLSLVAPLGELPEPPPARTAPPETSSEVVEEAEVAEVQEAPEPTATGIRAIAEDYIGIPYRWGGKTRSGLDCSGFVFNVFRDAGITDTYRTSGSLRDWTTPISRAEAREGDLVFGPGHVAIYLGDGMMIDAPRPGKSVAVRPVYSGMNIYGRVPA